MNLCGNSGGIVLCNTEKNVRNDQSEKEAHIHQDERFPTEKIFMYEFTTFCINVCVQLLGNSVPPQAYRKVGATAKFGCCI